MKSHKTESVSKNLPVIDSTYIGRWLGYSVVLEFDGYEVRFNVKHGSTEHEVKCIVDVSDGFARIVEDGYGRK
jgi:hypothetical protein